MISLNLRLFIALMLALVLTILPLPEFLVGLRPPWVLILTLYIQCFLPARFNLFFLVIIGILLDVLQSTVIGEHVFALTLVTWLVSTKARRFTFFSMGQQIALVGFFCLFYQLIILMIDAFLGFHTNPLMALGSALISMLLWTWVRLIADDALRMPLAYRR